MRRFLLILAVLAAATLAAQEAGSGRIVVNGEGAVETVPDMATISMGVTAEARTAAAALDQTSVATAAVLELLTASGIEARDMQTSDLTLSPSWDDRSYSEGRRQIVGGIRGGDKPVISRVRRWNDPRNVAIVSAGF